MNAQNDNTTPSSTTTRWRWGTPSRPGMQRIIAPWEYRHLRGWAGVRIAAGTVLAGLGAFTLFGGSLSTIAVGWSALFLAAAAAHFSFAAWELAIARSASARNLSPRNSHWSGAC